MWGSRERNQKGVGQVGQSGQQPGLILKTNQKKEAEPLAVMAVDKGDLQRLASSFCRPLSPSVPGGGGGARARSSPQRHDGAWICMQVNWWTVQRNCSGRESLRSADASRWAASYLGTKRIIPYQRESGALKESPLCKNCFCQCCVTVMCVPNLLVNLEWEQPIQCVFYLCHLYDWA